MAQKTPEGIALTALLDGIAEAPPMPVADLTLDSRAVRPGSVFLACRGGSAHGLDYAGDAATRGATALLYDPGEGREPAGGLEIPGLPVPGLRAALGEIASRFFGAPSERLGITAVTGTNGKTTVAHLVAGALSALGRSCGYVGTLGAGLGPAVGYGVGSGTGRGFDRPIATEPDAGEDEGGRSGARPDGPRFTAALTTPDVIELQRTLARLQQAGAQAVALEASSHALDQRRLDGVEIDVAVFTNLSRDHLDYHGSMERYAEAKARLFERETIRSRVLNVDDAFGRELWRRHAASAGGSTIVTGSRIGRDGGPPPIEQPRDAGGRVLVGALEAGAAGLRLALDTHLGSAELRSPLVGEFNAANLASALGALLAQEVPLAAAVEALSGIAGPPGRMQRVAGGDDARPTVIVDYAHTPQALALALAALRPHCRGRLWCVFGCGGERDRGKRAPMAAAAAAGAHRVVITTDNPRGEDPEAIIAEVARGLPAGADALRIADRGAAIRRAVGAAGPLDWVVIAGKGHETHQEIGGVRRPFSDAEAARAALREAGP